ncbi:MAG TPA: response regulator [Thermoanaerobaculia bacterium]|nr:response regulator [Thermoanaerobaculia bacterium]
MTEKILIVDDDPVLLDAYARILEAAGFAVLRAGTGEEGLRLCRGESPDLVLLGAVLPDGDGVEICRRIKSDPALAGTFVIMLSGPRASPEDQVEGLEAGADGYLAKPIEQRALLAHVRALLRTKRTERELRQSEERQRALVEDLREANRRLEEYGRLKAEFVANMSHELRTPLTAIIGFAQLASLANDGPPVPPVYQRSFERILRNGRHLLALIDDVLDIAKIEAGRLKVHREHFDLAELVQSTFNEMQSLALQKKLGYRLRIPEDLPLAFTDPLRVRQVVINLLSNAIKFTHEGSIEAELVPWDGGFCRFIVRDTGVGIDEKSVKLIFERFRQVDGSMSRVAGGAGLGLSIVQQIVQLLGGRIDVESALGQGSTFVVTLPLVAPDAELAFLDRLSMAPAGEEASSQELRPTFPAPGEREARPLVLVIEDDPDTAAVLSEAISRADYRVCVAPAGSVGLKLAQELEPAAITLDVMMPGMDGWRVLQALKSERRTAEIPVVVCSIVDNRPLAYRLGASDYLIKPIDPERLMSSLHAISTGSPERDGYVLVLDDEHGIRELLIAALHKAGYDACAAASGETALRMILEKKPRIVLCDLTLPGGMSGYELIARLRSDPRTEDVPILVITGKDMTPEDRKFILGQITDVIRKGDLLMSDLESRLRETLEQLGVRPSYGQDPVD